MGGIPRELVLGLVTFSVLAGDVGLSALSVLSNTKLPGAVNMLQGRNMSSRGALTGLRGELVHFHAFQEGQVQGPAAGSG